MEIRPASAPQSSDLDEACFSCEKTNSERLVCYAHALHNTQHALNALRKRLLL